MILLRNLVVASLFIVCLSCSTNDKPNILWITCEDISPHLGCYGDSIAKTPNLDKLASEGIRYLNAYANAPVCTPARSTIITGVFASSLGTQHLRSKRITPEGVRTFPEYLREAGYYCTNNRKTDYNFPVPAETWDESGGEAHWRNRVSDQPFFSVFNIHITHQSRTRYPKDELLKRIDKLPEELRCDPDEIKLPPYYPDTEEIRNNMAALYTQITLMDIEAGKLLDQLKEDGLSEETIVFFYSDHGDGIPRGKRWLHETGTNVPLIIKFPDRFKKLAPSLPNSTSDRIVSFVDLAPTILNILDIYIPEYMQGDAFLGQSVTEENEACYLFSDRVGDVLDMSRGLRNERFRYIRNYNPFKPRMQYCDYSETTPIRQELRRLGREGQLVDETSWLLENSKPAEELYDLDSDPYEMYNLANDPSYRSELKHLRTQLNEKILAIHDLSFLPEAEMFKRARGMSPSVLNGNSEDYHLYKILEVANMVGLAKSGEFIEFMKDPDNAIRYWAVLGISSDENPGDLVLSEIKELLKDPNPNVRIAAAECLFIHRFEEEAIDLILKELRSDNYEIVLHAASTLGSLGNEIKPYLLEIKTIYESFNNEVYWNTYSGTPLKRFVENPFIIFDD